VAHDAETAISTSNQCHDREIIAVLDDPNLRTTLDDTKSDRLVGEKTALHPGEFPLGVRQAVAIAPAIKELTVEHTIVRGVFGMPLSVKIHEVVSRVDALAQSPIADGCCPMRP